MRGPSPFLLENHMLALSVAEFCTATGISKRTFWNLVKNNDAPPLVRIGRRVVLKPSWEEFAPEADDLIVELDPGMAFGTDSILIRGDPASNHFAIFHLKGDLIQAVEAVNAAPEFMAGKQFIGSRKPVSREKLADLSISMKEVAA